MCGYLVSPFISPDDSNGPLKEAKDAKDEIVLFFPTSINNFGYILLSLDRFSFHFPLSLCNCGECREGRDCDCRLEKMGAARSLMIMKIVLFEINKIVGCL